MIRAFNWLFPHPLVTLLLAVVWVLLQNDVSAGMAVFGLIVIWDIIVANIQVAWIVLTRRNKNLRPAWVVIPLDLRQPEAITVLAGTITLTPGTVSADMSDTGHCLLVHALDAPDPDAVRDDIKQRYEARLKEIFV